MPNRFPAGRGRARGAGRLMAPGRGTRGSGPFAPDLLSGQVAVVTGGATGIGLETARQLLLHGARVAIASRRPDVLDEAAESLQTETGRPPLTAVCDVRDEQGVRALAERVTAELGAADIVVNNAAANFRMPAERMTRRAFQTVVDIDLVGTFTVTRAFVGPMLERGSGNIISMVVPEVGRGFPTFSHAGAAKAGIVSLTASWAREWGPRGVRVNAVAPGLVPTEGVMAHMYATEAEKDAEDIPLRRLGTVTDIANCVLFLSSDAASWITGTTMTVDGGNSTMHL
ncbi:SDR family oxidoreductase [Streptomyces sedi]|uniref:SDR family oxidoreductase n=2 Tax=Streptomyces sedi TaxID=555059 RepID=A0A5C4UQW1_9ACTN|nr:SDR family oxidoreductase [Streptomyces sedi]